MDVEDSDSEYEVEESVVLVELNGIIDANFLLQEQTPTKILGIDTDQPILQIGHYIFSGEYEHTMGTVVLYQPTDAPKTDASGKDYEYLCKTDKKLTMKRIFIKEKNNDNIATCEEVPCTTPIPNGESNAYPITSNKIIDKTNNQIRGIPPEETYSEITTVENDARSLSTNLGKKQKLQKSNKVNKKSNIEKEPYQDTCPLPSKEKDSETDIPEKPSSPKNKDRKRKLDDSGDTELEKAEAESVVEETVPCRSGKQLKLDVNASDEQESHLEEKETLDLQEKMETDTKNIDDSLITDESEGSFSETDKSIVLEKEKFEQNRGSLITQDENKAFVQDKVETSMEKESSYIGSEKQISSIKKLEKVPVKSDKGKSNSKSNVKEKKKSSIKEKLKSINKEKSESSIQDRDKSNEETKNKCDIQEKSILGVVTKNETVEPFASQSSSSSIRDQENLLETCEKVSESDKEELSQTASTSKASNENNNEHKVIKEPHVHTLNNFSEERNICLEASDVDENEAALISNSEAVNQLVESSTDKMLFLDNVDEVRGDGNCSSSGDMMERKSTSVSSDICQSSDSKIISEILQESIEKFDLAGASSSTTSQQDKQARIDHEDSEARDSNECQTSAPLSSPRKQFSIDRDIENAGEGSSNALNLSVPFESEADEKSRSTKRKLSSCEVTQSSNSEKELSESPEEVSECEVFSQNPLPGIEGLFNRPANDAVEPLELAAGSSDEVEPSRSSLASEGSTSEVSQSHKSVIQESKSVDERNLEDSPFADGTECSQSSDQIHDNLNNTSAESNKDLCVSSCDVTKDSSVSDESFDIEKITRSTGCEVSQSDRLGASTSSNKMIVEELLSNECDAPISASGGSEGIGIGTLHPGAEVADTVITRKQMACEVSQSFSSTNQPSVSGMNLLAGSSNECGDYSNSGPDRVSNDDSNNNCVSSDDVRHFSPPLDDEIEQQVKDPTCEVSQSSRSGQNLSPDEPCASYFHLNVDKQKSKTSCEVSQSLEHQSSSVSELNEDDDDSNECERSDLNADTVDQSDDNVEEICESSDDVIIVSNDESNSQSEQVRPINYSGCEVSQSYRLEDGVLIDLSEQFFVGVESSNECEAYGSSVSSAPEYNVSHSDSEEKNVCESSDDIERSSGDVKSSSRNSKNDSQEACQSTKSDDNFACDTVRVDFAESNSNDPSNFIDDEINVCESSEDINITDNSPEINADACSSSEKLFKKSSDNNRQCDSFSSQGIAGPSTHATERVIEHGHISQSESESASQLVSSNSQRDTVKVSSSVDSIGNTYADVIYSSSNVSNSTISSNSEVSQSSAKKGPYVWCGNLLSAASSSNSSIISGNDNVSGNEQVEPSFSDDINVQSSARNSGSESTDSAMPSNTSMSSNRNNDATESSISSSLASGNRIKKHILKKSNELSSEQSTSTKEQKRESVILGGSFSSNPNMSDNSSFQIQPEVDSMAPQFPFQHGNILQFERSTNADPRPSLLEVMVSSASDFRNSLLNDSSSFSKETNNSSVVESSSNTRSSNEYSEPFISEATGGASGDASPAVITPNSFLVENSDSARTEVTGSLGGIRQHSSSESKSNRNQVSQSSDIVNTHSSTSQVPVIPSDGISESIRPDLVQSSSQVFKTSHIAHEDDSNKASASGVSFILSGSPNKVEVPESSSTQSSVLTHGANLAVSSENSANSIESSSDLPVSFHSSGNVDGEVSSMPPIADPVVPLMEGNEQYSVIEGNIVLLSESGSILNTSQANLAQVGMISAQGDFVQFPSGSQLLLQASNEADILNSRSAFSPSNIQLSMQETLTNISTPENEIQSMAATHGDGRSSEVSESLTAGQNEQSMLADNNVSCSVVEFSTIDNKYSFSKDEFSGDSREAESKSDDGISSFQSVCDDNILPVQNLPSSENPELSMYSHIGEFEDSIQSSSLDATHFSINEQIRAISSPPTFSNSDSSGERAPSSINAFASFSSESHNLPSVQYSLPSISSIPSSFMSGEISRLHTGEFLDSKSVASSNRDSNTISRQSPNTTFFQDNVPLAGNEPSVSRSHGLDEEIEESSQMSDLVGTENSPEEYEVLSEYEEIDNVEDDSNLVDSSND